MSDPENTAATRAHRATLISSEGTRQAAQRAALATFTAGGTAAAYAASSKAAELAHHKRVVASAIKNGIQPGFAQDALHAIAGSDNIFQ